MALFLNELHACAEALEGRVTSSVVPSLQVDIKDTIYPWSKGSWACNLLWNHLWNHVVLP